MTEKVPNCDCIPDFGPILDMELPIQLVNLVGGLIQYTICVTEPLIWFFLYSF